MNIGATPLATSWLSLGIVCLVLGGISAYVLQGLHQTVAIYENTQRELAKPVYSGSVGMVEFPNTEKPLNIPSWEVFQEGNIWTLVSRTHPLQPGYEPAALTDLPLPHGDSSQPMKVQPSLISPLTNLFEDARVAGYTLMISSAYRSIADQQKLYGEFVETQGMTAARQYVADPGSSEHHTGLAVDFSNQSDACGMDSDRCSLGLDTSAWLASNAHLYGFINRYPEGKQPITGISYEPWHYRYVGIPLATQIYQSDLTLDEALIQIRPAFSR